MLFKDSRIQYGALETFCHLGHILSEVLKDFWIKHCLIFWTNYLN